MGRGTQLVLFSCFIFCNCGECDVSDSRAAIHEGGASRSGRYQSERSSHPSPRRWSLARDSFPTYRDFDEQENEEMVEGGEESGSSELSPLARDAISFYCQNPFEATCGKAWDRYRSETSFSVDDGPVDDDFFEEVKNALGAAIFDDNLLVPVADQMWNTIKNVRLQIGNFSFCDPNRPNAMPMPPDFVVMCQGMYDKAAAIAAKEGKGVRSYVFHILAHELSHYLSDYLAQSREISDWLNGITNHFEEAGSDYLADRAIMYWKGGTDTLLLLNEARDGLQILCSMNQSPNHPLKASRAMMIRVLAAGQAICGEGWGGHNEGRAYY